MTSWGDRGVNEKAVKFKGFFYGPILNCIKYTFLQIWQAEKDASHKYQP